MIFLSHIWNNFLGQPIINPTVPLTFIHFQFLFIEFIPID